MVAALAFAIKPRPIGIAARAFALRAAAFTFKAAAWSAVAVERDRFDVDFFLDQLLNVAHQAGVAGRDQRHGQATGASAARAANAVDIVFGIERHVKVEDRRHVLDVQTASGHIGTDQQIDFAFFEGFQRFEALVLALVTVQGTGLIAFALE